MDYIREEAETDVAIDAQQPQHTTEQDFQHFLSYSGLWREPAEVIALLRRAFEAGYAVD